MGTWWTRTLKRFHPEGIPWPASVLYDCLSGTEVFRQHYTLVAEDVRSYGGNPRRILDIGTGPGGLLLALRAEFPEAQLIGLDISAAMLDRARRNIRRAAQGRSSGGIDLVLADAQGLPFDDDTFDVVVSTGSIHHWKDAVAGLSEAHRVLKAGGWALIYDLVRHTPEAVRRDVRARFGGFRLALLWLHSFEEPFLDPEEMVDLGRQTAFTVKGTSFVGALCCLVLGKGAEA
jgi:ubiquinone/menaquinone biosynthesis C-methylase UbiE